MRGKLVVTFLGGLVVGVVVAFAGWHPRALGQQAPQAQQWEYALVEVQINQGRMTRNMNDLGKDGWEYAGVLPNDMVVVKRPKK
jgi:hypothetical protein